MRKLPGILLILSILAALISCDSHPMLRSEVDLAQRDCPIDLGFFGQIDSVTYSNDDNTVHLYLAPSHMQPDTSQIQSLYTEFGPRRTLQIMREEIYTVLDQAMEDCAGFRIHLCGQNFATYSPDELVPIDSDTLMGDTEKTWRLLQYALKHDTELAAESEHPDSLDGVTLSGCKYLGTEVIYSFEIDDESYDNNCLGDSARLIISRDVLHNSASRSTIFVWLAKLNLNYRMEFTAIPSERTISLLFTPAQLDSIFKDLYPTDSISEMPDE